MRAQARRVGRGAQAAVTAIAAAASGDDCLYTQTSAYHGPVRALWGAHDRLIPGQHAAGVMAAFPDAQVTVWDGMGHHPQHERPDDLAAYLHQQPLSAPAPVKRRRGTARSQAQMTDTRRSVRAARQNA
jgi:pimeloyl-ACP methyl ester carboxylesterase